MAAPIVLTALSISPREGMKVIAAVIALIVVPAVVVVLVIAVWIGTALLGFSGDGNSSQPPSVPPADLAVMRAVADDSGVPWTLLAAISSVESGFGANMSTSSAGAIGYGQFLPATWAAFGRGGDPYDYRDVIPAMARYLRAAGAPADLPHAVYAYNHSWEYVALVLGRMAAYAQLDPAPTPTGLPIATPRAP